MVVVHVLEPRFGLVAAGPDVVVGDTLHRDGLRVTAGAGDHLLDLVAMIFVVPQAAILSPSPGVSTQERRPASSRPEGQSRCAAGILVLLRQTVLPDVWRFDDVVVDAMIFGKSSSGPACCHHT